MRSTKLASLIGVVVGVAAMAWGPSVASADTYAPGPDAQNFHNSVGDWTASTQSNGLCIPPLLCPSVSSSFHTAGGTEGPTDGYISADLIGLLSTTAATSSVLQESPAFIYNGNGGKVPATASFDLARLPNVSALLGVDVINDVTFRADLVDQSNSAVINLLPAVHDPTNDNVWAALPTQSVNPDLLALGHAYKIRITTTYHTTAAVIPSGSIGYDNIALSTAGVAGGGSGGGGGDTNNGGNTINNSNQLNALILSSGLPSVGVLKGNILRLRLKCPHSAFPNRCEYKVQGLAKGRKSKAATAKAKASIKFGGAKLVRIKVKPKFLAKYQKANKVTIKAKVRVGNISTTAYKKVRIVHKDK
jgi:hypothetical protein